MRWKGDGNPFPVYFRMGSHFNNGSAAIHHRLAEGVSVLRINRRWGAARALLTVGLAIVLLWELTGYHNIANAAGLFNRGASTQAENSAPVQASNKAPKSNKFASRSSSKISEVSPPPALQTLRQELENYQPQVTILSPKVNEVLQDTTVSVQFQVKDLPLFKNETLGLGPHLHVFLDNQPYLAVYDANQPLVFKDLPPGTHTIRAFASRPWHESFKNEGAYAQTTFHIFAKTQANTPSPQLPLLTYSRPQANYGAEPIMLDFYLTNAPLHLVAQESSKDEIADWRIRCTINGESFVLDRWQPIYLKGFRPGKNWVQLEYLDEQGNPVPNAFNNTVRLINYEPGGKDALSRLTRGDLSAADALGIVDPNYKPTPAPAPIQTPTPSLTPPPTPKPSVSPTPTPSVSPSPIVSPSPKPTTSPTIPPISVPVAPSPLPSPTTTLTKPPVQEAIPTPKATVKPPVLQSPDVTPVPQPAPEKPEPKNNSASKLFDRVRLPFGKSPTAAPKAMPVATPSVTPTDLPKPTASISPKTPATIESPPQPKTTPAIEPLKTRALPVLPQSQAPSPTKNVSPIPNATAVPKPDLPKSDLKTGLKSEPSPEPSPSPIEAKTTLANPAPSPVSKSSPNKYLERYRRPIPSPTMLAPTPTPADSTPAATIMPTP